MMIFIIIIIYSKSCNMFLQNLGQLQHWH